MATPRHGLKLTEFEDVEFLYALEDNADHEGWTSSQDLANGLRLDVDNPTRNVGARLSWLRRYGVVEYRRDGKKWRLTDAGRSLVHGTLTKAQALTIARTADERVLALTRAVSHELVTADGVAAAMMHRQWRYALAQRS